MAWLDRNRNLLLAAVALLLLAAFAAGSLKGEGSRQPLEFRSDTTAADGTPIRVHVAGAVAKPGVYDLLEGERVIDAMTKAGGALDGADTDAVNLARRLRDGEQVVVPTRTGAAAAHVPTLVPGAKLDVNTATEAQLDQLPGIGQAYAKRIADSRRVDGPFRSLDELVDRKVLPKATLDGVRAFISIGP